MPKVFVSSRSLYDDKLAMVLYSLLLSVGFFWVVLRKGVGRGTEGNSENYYDPTSNRHPKPTIYKRWPRSGVFS